MEILTAAAAAFVVTRLMTFINRWQVLRFVFTDAFLYFAQIVTIVLVLAGYLALSFMGVVLALALTDLAVATIVLVDKLIVAATLYSPPQRRR